MRKEFNPRWGPKEPNMWENGPLPPMNATFDGACVVAISDTEFILAGGKDGLGPATGTTSVFKHTGLREWSKLRIELADQCFNNSTNFYIRKSKLTSIKKARIPPPDITATV